MKAKYGPREWEGLDIVKHLKHPKWSYSFKLEFNSNNSRSWTLYLQLIFALLILNPLPLLCFALNNFANLQNLVIKIQYYNRSTILEEQIVFLISTLWLYRNTKKEVFYHTLGKCLSSGWHNFLGSSGWR